MRNFDKQLEKDKMEVSVQHKKQIEYELISQKIWDEPLKLF